MHACHSPSLFVSRTPFPFPPHCFYAHIHTHTQGDTRGRVDAALSALRWGVLLLTTVWIEAAVHPLLSGCCRAAGLTFVLRSIMARHNYSLSREGTQAVSTLPLASPQLAGQQRHTQANISFKCVLKLNMSAHDVSLSQEQVPMRLLIWLILNPTHLLLFLQAAPLGS